MLYLLERLLQGIGWVGVGGGAGVKAWCWWGMVQGLKLRCWNELL